MVRKKQPPKDQRLEDGEETLESLVEDWLQRVRSALPDGGTAVVTVHKISRRKFLVAFRASAAGETFISEVREESLEQGVRLAGSHLLERLAQSTPEPKENLREKLLRLFGEEQEAV